jgi:hypothetical protein
MTTDTGVLALRAVAFGLLQDRLKEAATVNNTDLKHAMVEGDRKTVRVPMGGQSVKVGSVTFTEGSGGTPVASVSDADALTKWVESNRPDAIVKTISVAAWFVAELLTAAERKGDAVDEHGELIPGITVRISGGSTAHIQVTREKTDEAVAALIGAIFADGVAGVRSLLALPSSPSQTGDSSK